MDVSDDHGETWRLAQLGGLLDARLCGTPHPDCTRPGRSWQRSADEGDVEPSGIRGERRPIGLRECTIKGSGWHYRH